MDDLDVDLPKASTKLALDWAKDELVGMRRGVIEDGAKMVLLLDLIDESVAIGDKVRCYLCQGSLNRPIIFSLYNLSQLL